MSISVTQQSINTYRSNALCNIPFSHPSTHVLSFLSKRERKKKKTHGSNTSQSSS